MAKLGKQEIIDALKELSALELSELVKDLEEVFGVSAAAPVAVAAAPAAGGGGDAAAGGGEDKSSFDVILDGFGDNKIAVIKAVREITGLGLKEAKDIVEGAPKPILEGADKDKAEEAKKALEDSGAAVSLK